MNEERPEENEDEFEYAPSEYPLEEEQWISSAELLGEKLWSEVQAVVRKTHELFDKERDEQPPWLGVKVYVRPAFTYLARYLYFKINRLPMTKFEAWDEGRIRPSSLTREYIKCLEFVIDEYFHAQFHYIATGIVPWYLSQDSESISSAKPETKRRSNDPGCENAIELLRNAVRYYLHPDLKGDFEKIKEAVEANSIIGPHSEEDWLVIRDLVMRAYQPPPPPPPYVPLPPAENGFDDYIPF